jgi:hypothetical protein
MHATPWGIIESYANKCGGLLLDMINNSGMKGKIGGVRSNMRNKRPITRIRYLLSRSVEEEYRLKKSTF